MYIPFDISTYTSPYSPSNNTRIVYVSACARYNTSLLYNCYTLSLLWLWLPSINIIIILSHYIRYRIVYMTTWVTRPRAYYNIYTYIEEVCTEILTRSPHLCKYSIYIFMHCRACHVPIRILVDESTNKGWGKFLEVKLDVGKPYRILNTLIFLFNTL